ncbi:MAG: NAD-dependent epimerase/dehydratase family protein [Acidobacteriota bacterium]
MRCLVTGASGHLGSHLTKRLLQEGWNVAALVRPESDLWRLKDLLELITVIRSDLSHVSEAAQAITQAQPEAVFHLAWQGVTSAFKNEPGQLVDNVAGSLKLLEIARDAGAKLWVGIGSQAEYGPHPGVLSEDTPANPETAYGAAKLRVGLQTKELCELSGIRHVWLRLLATYGPMDDERHLIPTVIRQLLKGERPRLTRGEQLWDYLYIEDAADAIYRAAVSKDARGVFNLGSGKSHSVRSILERIRDLIDPSLSLGFGEAPYPPDQTMRLETNIDRLRQATGWSPKVDLDVGLARTVDWYKTRRY